MIAVLAVQPWNSAEFHRHQRTHGRLQMSALALCLYFVCHLLRKESPTLWLVERGESNVEDYHSGENDCLQDFSIKTVITVIDTGRHCFFN